MLNPSEIGFRQLAEADLKMMIDWLRQDFVQAWYSEMTIESLVVAKYLPRIQGKSYVKPYCILYGDKAIGYIQTYRLDETPASYRDFINIPDCAGIDLFIGEADYIHQNLGSTILQRFLKFIVFPSLDVQMCIIAPTPNNQIAIRAYEKAGFHYLKTVQHPEDDEAEYVMIIHRDALN